MKRILKRQMTLFLLPLVVAALVGTIAMPMQGAAKEQAPKQVLFTNVNIFDGTNEKLAKGMNVLVERNLIKKISKGLIKANAKAAVIDGGGRTLMPGMINAHAHLNLNGASLPAVENNMNWEEIAVRSVRMAHDHLMDGFTTVRDVGGMNTGLHKSIDNGVVVGPRLYTSGAFIGPTGGHSDFRNYSTPNESITGIQYTQGARLGMTYIADGPDAIKAAVRQNFMQGNTQIKIMPSGGVASEWDPWQLNGYSREEIRAAVEVAEGYGSYVMAHAYSKKSIMRCLEEGVKTIEHGFMFDGDIAKLMEKKDAYITTNMTSQSPLLGKIDALQSPRTALKLKTAQEAFKDFVPNVKKYKPKMGFQVDCVGGPELCMKQRAYEKWLQAHFFGNFRMLKAATSTGGEIMALSGIAVNPYPEGKLGVIEEGAYADILLVDGNPLEDITVIGGVDKWFDAPPRDGVETIRLIMKDGKIYKNTLK